MNGLVELMKIAVFLGLLIGIPMFILGGIFYFWEQMTLRQRKNEEIEKKVEEDSKVTKELEALGLTKEDLGTVVECHQEFETALKEYQIKRNTPIADNLFKKLLLKHGLQFDEKTQKLKKVRAIDSAYDHSYR